MTIPQIKEDKYFYITLMIGSCVAYSGLYAMPLWIGAYADHLHLSSSISGYMGSLQLMMAATASIWVSGKINHYSAAKLAFIGTALVLFANIASALGTSIPLLFFVRAISGIGEGILLANLNVYISRTSNPDKFFALSQTTIAVFGIILFFTAPQLMKLYGIWGIFGIICFTAILGMTVVKFMGTKKQESDRIEEKPAKTSSFLSLFTSFPLLALGVLFVGCQGAWAYFERMGVAKGFNVDQVGQFIVIGLIISLLGPYCANFLASKIERKKIIVIGLAISGSAVLLASQNIAPDYFIISAAIFPFGTLFIVTSFLGYLNYKDSSGKLIASAPAFINIGGALGPAIMGGILINYTLVLVGFVVIFIYSLASILVYLKK